MYRGYLCSSVGLKDVVFNQLHFHELGILDSNKLNHCWPLTSHDW